MYPIQERLQRTHQPEAGEQANSETNQSRLGGLAHHELKDVMPLGPECQANTDLVSSLAYSESYNCGKAY